MPAMEVLADDFLKWWSDPQSVPDFSSRLAPGFSYRWESGGLVDDDAMWRREERLPLLDVGVKEMTVVADTVTFVINFIEPVTLLSYRATVRVRMDARGIVSVSERSEFR